MPTERFTGIATIIRWASRTTTAMRRLSRPKASRKQPPAPGALPPELNAGNSLANCGFTHYLQAQHYAASKARTLRNLAPAVLDRIIAAVKE